MGGRAPSTAQPTGSPTVASERTHDCRTKSQSSRTTQGLARPLPSASRKSLKQRLTHQAPSSWSFQFLHLLFHCGENSLSYFLWKEYWREECLEGIRIFLSKDKHSKIMTHNPLPNHGIKLTYHGILKDAVFKVREYYLLCVARYLKIFTQSKTTKFLSTIKKAKSSPRGKKSHHIFIAYS